MNGMAYFKFFPSDWRTGCLVLSLEEEGLYIRCCAYMYDTHKVIPTDDKEASRLLNVQVQQYQKLMKALIAKGKMIRAQGWIINERVQEEIDKYRVQQAARSEAAKKRESARKAQLQQKAAPQATPGGTSPLTSGGTPAGTSGGPKGGTPEVRGQVTAKKTNEINETRAQPWHGSGTALAQYQNPESRIQKPEEERTTTGEPAASVGGGEYLDCLNGSAVDLTVFIGKHAMVDTTTARSMLGNNVKAFGADALLQAYSVTLAEMTSGLVAQPYKYLIGTARKLKEGKERRAPSGKGSAETQADKISRFAAEFEEKSKKGARP